MSDTIEITLRVPNEYGGWRLDHFLRAQMPRLSRARIQRMIAAQQEARLRPAARVKAGEVVRLIRPAPVEPDVPRCFDIVYDDEALIAISKPPGLPVHATARFHHNTLTALLRERYGAEAVPRPAHRLDRETSGLMLLARTREVEAQLKRQLARRRISKVYLAIVHGYPGAEGAIDLPVGEDTVSGVRVRRAVCDDGLPALTHYRTLERRGAFSLVEARPRTGRQHQIRLHLSAIGSPIVGDKLYGDDPGLFLEYLETGWTDSLKQRLLLERHALHAAELTFVHPLRQSEMTLHCPLAADLEAFWQHLGAGLYVPEHVAADSSNRGDGENVNTRA